MLNVLPRRSRGGSARREGGTNMFFVSHGQKYEVTLEKPRAARAVAAGGRRAAKRASAESPASNVIQRVVDAKLKREKLDPSQLAIVQVAGRKKHSAAKVTTIATQTFIVEGAHQSDLAAAKNLGARVINESYDGKALLKVDTVEGVFRVIQKLLSRNMGAISPNFYRHRHATPASVQTRAWAHRKIGVSKAWNITRGSKDVLVAVLDEGVDTRHPALKAAVVAERDFIGTNGNSAMPDGDDAHGTACAGIIVSRSAKARGIAPRCGLIAARIAKGDGQDGWVFEDWATADAIDWCWREGAAILSNSWGGGPPSDAISRAMGRARTQGRNGKGSLVVIAAGNAQEPIDFPGNLPGYVTVGASNPADERKTLNSSDGEDWWGSNFGPTISLLAPGVFIHTTDIAGQSGYDEGDFTKTFNGTSSATPHVAGAAALMLSANPQLSVGELRTLLQSTAKPLQGQSGFDEERGFGRLDVAAAVRAALPAQPAAPKKKRASKAKSKRR